MINSKLRGCALAAAVASTLFISQAGTAVAAGTHAHGHGGDIGEPGKAANASRTVEVVLHDNYFEPESLEIKAGETVRFVVRNEGALVHEFSIGTAAMHEAHEEEMAMMVEHGVLHADHIDEAAAKAMQESMGHGMHEAPNSVLLEPGQSAEVVWTLPHDGSLEFACNVPGHYAAGMQGPIRLQP